MRVEIKRNLAGLMLWVVLMVVAYLVYEVVDLADLLQLGWMFLLVAGVAVTVCERLFRGKRQPALQNQNRQRLDNDPEFIEELAKTLNQARKVKGKPLSEYDTVELENIVADLVQTTKELRRLEHEEEIRNDEEMRQHAEAVVAELSAEVRRNPPTKEELISNELERKELLKKLHDIGYKSEDDSE